MSHTASNSTLGSGTSLASYSLGWDLGGRLVSMTSTADDAATFTYDRTDQLKSATYEKPAYADLNFSYDANGNRTGGGNIPGPDNRQASDGVSDFAYDLDGNMTRRTDKTTGAVVEYAWDLRNRLTDVTFKSSVTGPITKTVHYTYDALNRRIGKSVDTDGNGTQDQVDWFANRGLRTDRENAGDEVMLRLGASGNVTGRYLHGASVDEILAEENIAANGTRDVLWPLADQQGSVRDIARRGADGRATIVNHVMYGPFGEKVAETDTAIAHLYGYTGREYDQETGLQYNRARYYDPKLGRFISQDPMSFGAGDANLYRMTGNHPNMANDPSGLDEVSLPWFAGNDVTYTPEGAFTGLLGIGIEWDHPAEAFTIGKLSSDRLHVIMDDGLLVPVSEIRKLARSRKTGVGQTVKQWENGELHPQSISNRSSTMADIRALAPLPAEQDSIAKGLYNSVAKPIAGAHQILVLGMDAVADPVGAADKFFVPWDPYEAISNSNRLYFDQAFDSREGTAEFTGSTVIAVTPWSKVGGLTAAAAERIPYTIIVDRSTLSMSGLGGIKIIPSRTAVDAPSSAPSRFSKTTTPWQRPVHQRSDIDWDLVRPDDGLTNFQAARRGYTPKRINPETGKWDDITLHHLNDDPRGGVVEVWSSTHGRFHKTMSREPNPWRAERPDWATAWDNEQSAYWRWRTGAYNPTPTSLLRLPGDQ